ncbi:hypothetical protein ACOZ38_37265 [Sphaerisporangium viridialbum]|uniref:hypothetical protein n=1 Tax=Sphaerisporangium viridialbum TaxID=46189 RepID=UPI003C787CCC
MPGSASARHTRPAITTSRTQSDSLSARLTSAGQPCPSSSMSSRSGRFSLLPPRSGTDPSTPVAGPCVPASRPSMTIDTSRYPLPAEYGTRTPH